MPKNLPLLNPMHSFPFFKYSIGRPGFDLNSYSMRASLKIHGNFPFWSMLRAGTKKKKVFKEVAL